MVLIAANQDAVFQRLTQAMGKPELSQQSEYATHSARGARQKEIDALIGDWTRTKKCTEVLELMEEFSVPAGLIYRAPEMLEDPHFQAREAIVSVPHPEFGELKMQNVAPKLSRTPGRVRSPSPQLGQHNDEVYRGLLAMNAERYAQLKAAKVI
jgi:formyl-CoA transferase